MPGATEDRSAAPATIVMEGESLALAAGAAGGNAAQAPRRPQQGGQQQQFGQGQGGKRWKKKFRDRERRTRSDNPGNDFRSETAPATTAAATVATAAATAIVRTCRITSAIWSADSSARTRAASRGSAASSVRWTTAIAPAMRTTPMRRLPRSKCMAHRRHRHQGDNQPLDFSGPRPVPIPEDAQTHIYLFIEDLFLTAKINETARKLGVKVAFVKNEKEALAELISGEDENKPSLIVFDLNNANAKPLTTIPKLKTKLKRSVSVIGFLSHLQGDLKAKAVEAGCDVVMPRAAFSQNLPNLLRRYGAEDEEEVNFNY